MKMREIVMPWPSRDLHPNAADESRRIYSYNPATGEIRRRIRTGQKGRAGEIAGFVHDGYRRIRFMGKSVAAHRLAWLMMYGCWPIGEIDHINGDRADNRIANLRDVDTSTNLENLRRARRDNKIGVLGVRERYGRFEARICVKGHAIQLGTFDSKQEASAAYLNAKRRMHSGCTI